MIATKGGTHSGTCDHSEECCPHSVTGLITTGSQTVKAGGQDVARVGDLVEHNCPHCGTGHISQGSTSVRAEGQPVSRAGDTVTYPGGSGVITNGIDNVKVGD